MALSSGQQALKDAINSGNKSGSSYESALESAMRSGYESMSSADRAALNNSGSGAYSWSRGQAPIPVMEDPYAEIKRQQAALVEAQKQQRIASLKAVKEQGTTRLASEQQTIAPKYLEQRTGLGVSSQLQGRSLEEYFAQRGLTSSGASAQGEIARNVATQQGLTDIGTQEAGAYADIERRKTELEQTYNQGVAGAENEATATSAQNQINALMQQQSAQESSVAEATKQAFTQQMEDQKNANALMLKQLDLQYQKEIEAGKYAQADKTLERRAQLDLAQAELQSKLKKEETAYAAKYKGTGGTTATDGIKLNSTQLAQANAISKLIQASPGQTKTFLDRVTDPTVRSYLAGIFGSYPDAGVAADPSSWNFAKDYAKSQGVQGY